MTDYRTHCAWCHADLSNGYITFLPAFDYQYDWHTEPDELAIRYCSAKCVRARRSELFHRRKMANEKWPRFTVEVPPELAAMLDAAIKAQLGVNVSAFSRAGVARRALRMLLDEVAPVEEPAIEATGEDVIDFLEIEQWTGGSDEAG